jgi:hypothetical protein
MVFKSCRVINGYRFFISKNKIFLSTINQVSKGFNALGISAKGSGLAIRGALVATGIGLLIVGITTLIANFEELKALAQPLIKAFQPFFDGVRDLASLLSGGLIDNASVNRISNTFETLNNESSSDPLLSLCALAANAPRELHVLGHDRHTLGVNCAQVGVLKQDG